MDAEELSQLGVRQADKIRASLASGNQQKALEECASLEKECLFIQRGLGRVVQYIAEHLEALFREEQARIAGEITAAVQDGRMSDALALLDKRDEQYLPVHDFYIDTMVSAFSAVGRAYGDRALEGLYRYLGERQKKGFEDWQKMPVEDFVRATARLFRAHTGRFTVTEDEERFTFVHDPCGSGGRLLREGAYDGPDGQLRIQQAQPMTFGRPEFPAYCAHCAIWNSIQPLEWFGAPQWVYEPARDAADVCRLHIYKDPSRIPAEYLEVLRNKIGG